MVRAPHPGGVSTPGSSGSFPFHCLSRRTCRRQAEDLINGWSSTVQALSAPEWRLTGTVVARTTSHSCSPADVPFGRLGRQIIGSGHALARTTDRWPPECQVMSLEDGTSWSAPLSPTGARHSAFLGWRSRTRKQSNRASAEQHQVVQAGVVEATSIRRTTLLGIRSSRGCPNPLAARASTSRSRHHPRGLPHR
jgi:hypothetical protein